MKHALPQRMNDLRPRFRGMSYAAIFGLMSVIAMIAVTFSYVWPVSPLFLWLALGMLACMVGMFGYRQTAALLDEKLQQGDAVEQFYHSLIKNNDPSSLVATINACLSEAVAAQTVIFLAEEVPQGADEMHRLPVDYCMKEKSVCGVDTALFADSDWHYVPMVVENTYIATLCVYAGAAHITPSQWQLTYRLAQIAAFAIEQKRDQGEGELARTNLKVEEARSNQEVLEKMRSTLLSSIAHDLKTPLAAIIGSLSAIRHLGNTLKIHTQHDLIAMAQSEAERLNHFITNILELSKLESGKLQLQLDWCDPLEIMQCLVKRMSFNHARNRIMMIPSEPVSLFHVDALLMEQVLQNIIDNCIKYTPEQSKITVRSQIIEGKGVLTVADEGRGIAESKQLAVFDKYYRAHKEKDGTGLGLAICKAIIEAHGGKISVAVNPEQQDPEYPGCLFTIMLPEGSAKQTPLLYSNENSINQEAYKSNAS